jgi:hypothetical protein
MPWLGTEEIQSGDMGDSVTILMGTQGVPDGLEAYITPGPKTQCIDAYLRDRLSVTELCELYGIRRKTADKWIDPYLIHGHRASKSAPAGPTPRPATRPTMWW